MVAVDQGKANTMKAHRSVKNANRKHFYLCRPYRATILSSLAGLFQPPHNLKTSQPQNLITPPLHHFTTSQPPFALPLYQNPQ